MRMTPLQAETIIRSRVKGLDSLAVSPLPDIGAAAPWALSAIRDGLIPPSYRWTLEKTERAFGLKDYGGWARSVILAAKFYLTDDVVPGEPEFGRIARFTWRNNYAYITLKLREAVGALEEALGRPIRSKSLSNYTSIPEKALFRLSGLADAGKNGVLMHPNMGSYFTVGEAFCDLELCGCDAAPRLTPPRFDACGDCKLCRNACPTGAIVRDGAVNVNRCFQYMSENLVIVPAEDRERWGSRVYGCSECLDACPFNERLEPRGEKHEIGFVGPGFDLLGLLELGENEWRRRFRGNQVGIRDRLAILKNVVLSLGWLEYRKASGALIPFLSHAHHVIRASAVWALRRIGTSEGTLAIERLARIERNIVVFEEIERSL